MARNKKNIFWMIQSLPLTFKMLLITVVAGIAAWSLLDYWQSGYLKELFHNYLKEIVRDRAMENRIIFDNHVMSHNQAVRLLVAQKNLQDYLDTHPLNNDTYPKIRFQLDPPSWLPRSSVLRILVPLRYVLLLDSDGQVREVYQGQPEPPPPTLLQPSRILRQLSHNQSFLTLIDHDPYLITSETVLDVNGHLKATLMLATPLDHSFLSSALGPGRKYMGIVALLEGTPPHIIASNQPASVPPGMTLDEVKKRFLLAGQSVFDYGSSDLRLQLITLISTEEFEKMNQSILKTERQQRAVTAIILIIACLSIMIWITRKIEQVTRKIVDFSKNTLGVQPQFIAHRDELRTLKEQFEHLSKEVILTKDSLQLELKERERADQEVRKLLMAVEQSPVAVMITKTDGEIIYVNPIFIHLTGYSTQEAIGNNWCFPQADEVSQETYQEIWHTVNTGQTWQGRLRPKRKDGKRYWERNTISPIRDSNREITHFLIIKEDISLRFEMEKTLEQAREAAETANQVKNDFLANITHELRTPLNAISGCSKLIFDETLGPVNKNQKKYLKDVLDSAVRLSILIDNLLNLSKVDSEQFILEKNNFNIVELVTSATLPISKQARAKGLLLTTEFSSDLPQLVVGDPTRLRQVLLHILNNGIKFTSRGGILLKVEIELEQNASPIKIRFTIRDTGIGIPKDQYALIFDPFTQVDHSNSREYDGTGLGLAIVKRLVELMGGAIRVESELGQGSAFIVTIPFIIPFEESLAEPPVECIPQDLKIYVAGRNPINRMILTKLFSTMELDVIELPDCSTVSKLLEEKGQEMHRILALDCMPANEWGIQEALKLRQVPGLSCLPLILFGGDGTSLVTTTLALPPAVFVLSKPIQRTQVYDTVRKALMDAKIMETMEQMVT
ncbi:MAG: ATP-binding protein [Magnetococcus sp. DMHC-6]